MTNHDGRRDESPEDQPPPASVPHGSAPEGGEDFAEWREPASESGEEFGEWKEEESPADVSEPLRGPEPRAASDELEVRSEAEPSASRDRSTDSSSGAPASTSEPVSPATPSGLTLATEDVTVDDLLVAWARRKSLDEWTPTELGVLRRRWNVSEPLRRILTVDLGLQGGVEAALKRAADEEAAESGAGSVRTAAAPRPPRGRWLLVAAVLLPIACGAYFVWQARSAKNLPAPTDGSLASTAPGKPDPGSATAASGTSDSPAGTGDPASSDPADPPAGPATTDPAAPQIPLAGTDARPWRKVIEAENFARSNLRIDRTDFGEGIGVLVGNGQAPGFAEYELDVPRQGMVQVELRYAADEHRPLRLEIDEKPVRDGIASDKTGGWGPPHQKAVVAARFEIAAGRRKLRLSAGGAFPHLDKLAVMEVPDGGAETSAKASGLPLLVLDRIATDGSIAEVTLPFDPLAEPRPFEEYALESPYVLQQSGPMPPVDRFFKRWFEPYPGRKWTATTRPTPRPTVLFDGVARLKPAWPEEVAWRLGAYGIGRLRIHLRRGETGLLLEHLPQTKPATWVAYGTQPDPKAPLPQPVVLRTTDNGAHSRSGTGTFDLRHGGGELVLSTGSIRLLAVPWTGTPDEVVVDGQCYFSHASMFRAGPVPETIVPDHAEVPGGNRPARRAWNEVRSETKTTPVPTVEWSATEVHAASDAGEAWEFAFAAGGKLVGREDGPVVLDGSGAKTAIAAGTVVGPVGLREIVFRVRHADVGTGVALMRPSGGPVAVLSCRRDPATGRRFWQLLGAPETTEEGTANEQIAAVPYAGGEQWIRLVISWARTDVWFGTDGRHWGRQSGAPVAAPTWSVAQFGPYVRPKGDESRRIEIDSLSVRELSGIVDTADPKLVEQVEPFEAARLAPGRWEEAFDATCPAGVDLDAWRRACAVRVLMDDPDQRTATEVAAALVASGLRADRGAEERFRLLEDYLSLPGNGALGGNRMHNLIETFGLSLVEEGVPEATARIQDLLIRHPLWTASAYLVPPSGIVRNDLLKSLYDGRWDDAVRTCRERRFWIADPNVERVATGWTLHQSKLCGWIETTTQLRRPVGERRELQAMESGWRHPLLWQLSKEGYNVMAEFNAAVTGRAYEDACRIMTSAGAGQVEGLLPDATDQDLLLSLQRAVALAMREHDELRDTMRRQFGGVAQVRARQAMSDGDVSGVESATVRFFGTEAASEAHRWLGDRALSAGLFGEATEHFRAALRDVPLVERPGLEARLRLAGALQGRDLGEPVRQPVDLGETVLSVAEFEALVKELVAARSGTGAALASGAPEGNADAHAVPAPAPATYEAQVRTTLDGDRGRGAGNNVRLDERAALLQLGTAAEAERIYVNNRFQVTAFARADGKKLWTESLGAKDQGDDSYWPLVAMRPLRLDQRLVVRRIANRGAELSCLEAATGKVVWRTATKNQIVSDPVAARGRIMALVAGSPEHDLHPILLAGWHTETGEALFETPLLQMRDLWQSRPSCTLTVADGKLVFTVPGSIACCDLDGRMQWQRRRTWLPVDLDPNRWQPLPAAPLIASGRVWSVQTHARDVLCLDVETGRRAWTVGVPGIVRVAGLLDSRLILETTTGLEARDAESGRLLWSSPLPNAPSAVFVGGPGRIAYASRAAAAPPSFAPYLAWLDPETGREIGRTRFESLSHTAPLLGPFVADGDGLLGFRFDLPADSDPELVRFAPVPKSAPLQLSDPALAAWLPHEVDDRTKQAQVDRLLPGWGLASVGGAADALASSKAIDAEESLRIVRVDGLETVFYRRIDVPKTAAPKLRVACAAPNAPWVLQVTVDGQVVLERDAELRNEAPRWQTSDVDLRPFAGRTVSVSVSHRPKPTQAGLPGYLRSIELVP